MNNIDLSQIDLNLLVALEALLTEASVSRAAQRLGVGQPAASHALARLRELFGDPLLVRVGRRMVPTTRAEALRAPVSRLLDETRRLLRHEPEFDAASSTRSFVLACPDLLAPLVPTLLTRLREQAPRARLELDATIADVGPALEHGRADVALVPMPDEAPGLIARRLGCVRTCVLARTEHCALRRGRLTLAKWLAYPHVVVRTGSASPSYVGRALEAAGHTREVGLIVPNFLTALVTVARTDLFYAGPRELVTELAPTLGLRIHPLPLPIPEIPVAALWHERVHADPGHAFFRAVIIAAAEDTLA
jgi:DNA-binding transcriptional LysR family regulator